MALLDIVLPAVLLSGALRLFAHLRAQGLADGLQRSVTGRFGEGRVHAKHLLVEIFHVLLVIFFCLLVCLRNAHQLQKSQAVGVVIDSTLGNSLPIALDDVVAAQIAVVGQVAVHVVPIQHPVPGLQAAGTGDPHRRVRLLHRTRPDTDVAQLVVLAVENRRLVLGPGLHDHVVRLGVTVTQGNGHLPVREGSVHRGSHRKTGDQTPVGNDVEHRHLLGHAHGRVVQGEAVTQYDHSAVVCGVRQHRSDQIGRWHDAVCIVVMLVDADAVKTNLVGVAQLVNVLSVVLVALGRVKVFVGQVYPRRVVLLGEIVRQVLVWHEVEE